MVAFKTNLDLMGNSHGLGKWRITSSSKTWLTPCLSVDFKMKTLRITVFEGQDKNQLKFCRKSYWKKQPFILLSFDESRFSNICTIMELKELNWVNLWKTAEAANLVFQWIFYWIQQSTSSSMWVLLREETFAEDIFTKFIFTIFRQNWISWIFSNINKSQK